MSITSDAGSSLGKGSQMLESIWDISFQKQWDLEVEKGIPCLSLTSDSVIFIHKYIKLYFVMVSPFLSPSVAAYQLLWSF